MEARLNRREFVKAGTAGALGLTALSGVPAAAEKAMTTAPNILFAIADDASHMSAYGHPWLRTPHFDRVAREGVRFTNYFVTNPKCAPSRACILTGRHTWQLGEACNHWAVFSAQHRVYTDILGEAGYHVGHTGKGWGPGDWGRDGRTENPAGPAYHGRQLTAPTRCISNKDYAGNFADFLAKRPPGAPFCFWYGGHEPHRPYEPGSAARAGKTAEQVRVPAYWPDTDVVRGDMLDYAMEIEWFDEHLGRMLKTLEEAGELENTLVVVTSDNGAPFPRVKGQIYEHDCLTPLAVRWGGRCPPGRVVDDILSCIDLAPTFLEAAGLTPPEAMSGRSFLDLLTTNASGRSDATRDAAFLGKERHDLGREGDKGYPVRAIRTHEFFYARNFEPDRWPAGNPETGFTNIDSSPTKDLILALHEKGESRWYELCMGKHPAEELYRIADDPDCVRNLAGDPAYAGVLRMLRERLETTLRETGDPRIFGKGDLFDTYEYVNAEKNRHSWKAYTEGRWEKQRY